MLRGIKQRLYSPFTIFSQILFLYTISSLLGYFWYLQSSSKQYFLYLFLAEIITISRPRVDEMEKLVRTGQIAPFLVRPASLFFQFLPYCMGASLFDFAVLTLASLPVLFLLGFPSPVFFLLAPLALLLAYTFSFIFQLLSFFLGETKFVHWIISKLILIAGGTVIPLNFLPYPLLSYLPFKYMVYAPVAFSLGMDVNIFPLFLWLFLLSLSALILEKMAVRHYEVGGG